MIVSRERPIVAFVGQMAFAFDGETLYLRAMHASYATARQWRVGERFRDKEGIIRCSS